MPDDLRTHCRSCSVQDMCVPLGMDAAGVRQIDALISTRLRFRRGETLYQAGDAFRSLYAVRVGSFKTTIVTEDGREQVGGYHMRGDVIGLDGIGTGRHQCQAIALEDAEVCVLPFERLEELAREVPQFQRNLHRFLSREISRDEDLMLILGGMRAEERVAIFLVSLAERYRRRGYSSTHFVLRMTREDIGSYLGLRLETVSRILTRFHADGLIAVAGRDIKLLDRPALEKLAGRHG